MSAAAPIRLLDRGLPVADLHARLLAHPEVWNRHPARTATPESPHRELDDIWVRFAAGDDIRKTHEPHESVWYPAAEEIDAIPTVMDVVRRVGGGTLGGVLITRIPPGATCYPHVDGGWHASEYQKYALQIASAPGQRFCFLDAELDARPGDLYWFRNDVTHWVINPTPCERITLIVCVKEN